MSEEWQGEFVKRERNLGCLRRKQEAGWWRGLWMRSRCVWVCTMRNAFGIEVESQCKGCGTYRHHLLRDRHRDGVRWRAGRHPVMEPEPEVRVNGFVISELWSRLEKREHYRRWMEGGGE